MGELIDVIETQIYTPNSIKKRRLFAWSANAQSLGFVDDVEFWFQHVKNSFVGYRSASRLGNFDFDANRKRIKALRQELEKKGWASQDTL